WPGRHATEDNPGLFAMAVLLETLQRTGASPQARLRLAADWTLSPPIDPPRRFGVESEPRSRADRMTASALTAYRVFHASHARHGPLVFGADEAHRHRLPRVGRLPLWRLLGLVGQCGGGGPGPGSRRPP